MLDWLWNAASRHGKGCDRWENGNGLLTVAFLNLTNGTFLTFSRWQIHILARSKSRWDTSHIPEFHRLPKDSRGRWPKSGSMPFWSFVRLWLLKISKYTIPQVIRRYTKAAYPLVFIKSKWLNRRIRAWNRKFHSKNKFSLTFSEIIWLFVRFLTFSQTFWRLWRL